MRWIISDVAMSKWGWLKLSLFFIFHGIAWVIDQIPVIIRRGEYRRLRDNDYVISDAHRIISENYELRRELRLARGLPEFDFNEDN